ncbi:hypothetical protein, partial [Klebsiella pneumoniae]|uniref:hypothetical protein n=1 Tax=Klebsiella pneumoniae TaxID=573 RepID=UPI00273026DF
VIELIQSGGGLDRCQNAFHSKFQNHFSGRNGHWSKLDSKTHYRLLVVSHVLCISVGEALALYFLFIGVAVATGL